MKILKLEKELRFFVVLIEWWKILICSIDFILGLDFFDFDCFKDEGYGYFYGDSGYGYFYEGKGYGYFYGGDSYGYFYNIVKVF